MCAWANIGAALPLNCANLALSGSRMPAEYTAQCADTAPATQHDFGSQQRSPTDIGYAIDIFGNATRDRDRIYTFQLNNFPGQTFDNSAQPFIYGADFAPNGSFYGVIGENAGQFPRTLGLILSGGFIAIGPLNVPANDNINGFAIHPRTGIAYLSTNNNSQPPLARLFTVNLQTGAATLVGPLSAPTDSTVGTVMISLAINCEGKLYAHNISDDSLYLVNRTTGMTTFIGNHGLNANFAQGMDFDNSTGELYAFMMLNSGENRFGVFNTQTGGFTTLANNNPPGEYEGAIPTSCPEAISLFANGFED